MTRQIGDVAYAAYRKHTGGKSLISGKEIPEWDGLLEEIRGAWEEAAAAVAALAGGCAHCESRESEPMADGTFDCWAIVEIMGHRSFAGHVTEKQLGGTAFIRVDVPAVNVDGERLPAFTKLLSAASIYNITPCTEETARAYAAQSCQRAFSVYEAPRLPPPAPEEEEEEEEEGWHR